MDWEKKMRYVFFCCSRHLLLFSTFSTLTLHRMAPLFPPRLRLRDSGTSRGGLSSHGYSFATGRSMSRGSGELAVLAIPSGEVE